MAPLLDIDLEQIAQIVERGRGRPEVALLLDARRLGVALGDDEPPQHVAELTGDLVPYRLAVVVAEPMGPAILLGLEEDAPAIVGHLDVVEVRPAVGRDRHCGAQVDVAVLPANRPHLLPPVAEVGLPGFERALQALVAAEVDVVGDLLVGKYGGHSTSATLRVAARP